MIMTVVVILNVAARFMPLDWLSFRAWEALVRYHAPCGPFRANAFYENPHSYGDLASLGNLPQYRQYRREIFFTDGFGFRRNSNLKTPPSRYEVLLVGDSFVVGTGVNDDETLAAKLEQSLGVGVYNGGTGLKPATLDNILPVAQRLNITKGTVLYEYYQQHILPDHEYLFGDKDSGEQPASCQNWRTRFSIWYDGFINISPLQILAQRIFKTLRNDFILPNVFKSEVVVKTLKNGEPILFFRSDFESSRRERGAVDVSGLKELASELEKNNLRLVLLLMPTKYTVYRPLLRDDDIDKADLPPSLDVVEKSLKEAHIPVINLLNLFRQKAQEDYEKNLYIYWRDDMHWNARGVKLAAEEILRQKLIQ